jgi:hypothetical protein
LEWLFLFIGFSLVSLGGAGLGMWVLVRCLLAAARGIKSKSWPTVEGTTNTSRIVEAEDCDSGGGNRIVIGHILDIEYSYKIAGKKYTSRQVSIGDEFRRFGSKERAEEMWAKYSTSTKVKVYYDPKRPRLSILETGFKPKTIIWGFVLGMFDIGAFSFLFFHLVLPGILNH